MICYIWLTNVGYGDFSTCVA